MIMRLGISLVALAASLSAHAQTGAPCDASVPVKGCRAEIGLEGKFIVLKSDTPKCSVIEWTLDGSPRATTVLDGEERIELLTTRPKELTIDNCIQVKDLRKLKHEANPNVTFFAVCKFDDSDVVIERVVVSSTRAEMTAAAQRACEPVMVRANRECFEVNRILGQMDALANDPNKDPTKQARYQQLRAELDSVRRGLPPYCN